MKAKLVVRNRFNGEMQVVETLCSSVTSAISYAQNLKRARDILYMRVIDLETKTELYARYGM